MEWISVKEWLPVCGQFVLCYGVGFGTHTSGPNIDICQYDGEWWDEGGTELSVHFPTHWMPLPEPPKQGAE